MKKRGFTLVELPVVIAIIGILINVPLNYGDFRIWCFKALSKWRRFFSSGFAA